MSCRIVAIAGGFDPFHEGHLQHIIGASELGDFLYVFISNDDDMVRKKGRCNISLKWRVEILRLILKGLEIRGEAVPTLDTDGTQTNTLRCYRPNILAKGGDRTPDNMPQNEIDVCREIGCDIIYGVGEQVNSSHLMVMT